MDIIRNRRQVNLVGVRVKRNVCRTCPPRRPMPGRVVPRSFGRVVQDRPWRPLMRSESFFHMSSPKSRKSQQMQSHLQVLLKKKHQRFRLPKSVSNHADEPKEDPHAIGSNTFFVTKTALAMPDPAHWNYAKCLTQSGV
jgi:hypothetical protein